jgi:hypothetical protein
MEAWIRQPPLPVMRSSCWKVDPFHRSLVGLLVCLFARVVRGLSREIRASWSGSNAEPSRGGDDVTRSWRYEPGQTRLGGRLSSQRLSPAAGCARAFRTARSGRPRTGVTTPANASARPAPPRQCLHFRVAPLPSNHPVGAGSPGRANTARTRVDLGPERLGVVLQELGDPLEVVQQREVIGGSFHSPK